jgi:nicotinate phosphoribosyltransferase
MIDIATRAYNHSFRIDPVIRSLLDTDFYKLLMLQVFWKLYPDVPVTFKLINRTRRVALAREVDRDELVEQLDHVRSLRFTESELVWLAGNRFYGRRDIFSPEFIEFLRGWQPPEYHLETQGDQFILTFSGPWSQVTLWEIYALTIVNTLRNRGKLSRDPAKRTGLARLSRYELDKLYTAAKTKLWNKLAKLKPLEGLSLADFGTRRRHDFLWQEWAVLAAREELGSSFIGTSNALIAHRHGIDAIGTNAHEGPMVLACLAGDDDAALAAAPYRVLEDWQKTYDGSLLVFLPDTFGTSEFLASAPDWVSDWTGMRVDSKDPVEAGEEAIAWWSQRGRDPRGKRLLFSDGLDVDVIASLHRRFFGRVRVGFGWGTLLTNDFRGCHPQGLDEIDPISLVCKVSEAAGRPAVKLSDNLSKATGPADEIERYKRVFGHYDQTSHEVIV